jgi:hypothetical protein
VQLNGADNQAMALLIWILALWLPQAAPDCTPQFAPLNTGTHSAASELPFWRKEDAGSWGGDGWLGWTYESDTLVPVRLVVRDLPKRHEDDPEEVTVERIPDVTFAVRCMPPLRAGPIRSAGVTNHELHHDGPLQLSLGERQYELRLQTAREDLFDAKVFLSDGRRTQLLYSADGFADDPLFQVEWAGDLDRDGKLDVIVNLTRKYSWHPHRLLLSSKASGSQLVGEAGILVSGD